MSFKAGDQVGSYRVIERIGVGGMGEVYRAHDSRLGRDVAIKSSAERFTERFEREARVVAALNHPNICTLHDIGPDYLVMELVEGESPHGPLPLDEALRIARQIADALEAAHQKGIVHRDLKPANIKVRPDGTVKVLDFGIATQVVDADSADIGNSPTISVARTGVGMIVGTASYMSPEQALGKRVDKRADIWAFGVVLYELITGRVPFKREDVGETLAAIINEQPSWDGIPASVRRLLESCLEKDPRKRLRDIGDAWRLLGEAPKAAERSPSKLSLAGWMTASVCALGAVLALWAPWRSAPAEPPVFRFDVPVPDRGFNGIFSVSPDGGRLAYFRRGTEGVIRLSVHDFKSLETHDLVGSETTTPTQFFWSWDGRFIVFSAEGKLKRIAVTGGPAETLTDLPGAPALGGTWHRDGVILAGILAGGIVRVAGGTATPVTALNTSRRERSHLSPVILPDGRHFLFRRTSLDSVVCVGSLDARPNSQCQSPLLNAENFAYVSSRTEAGWLLFLREGTLWAQRFNERSLELTGEAVEIADQVTNFSSSEITLIYRRGSIQRSQLTWLDREGRTLEAVGPPDRYMSVTPSPDGKFAAAVKVGESGRDLNLIDLVRGQSIRLSFGGTASPNRPLWSPEGDRIVFTDFRGDGRADIFWIAAHGGGKEEPLGDSPGPRIVTSWSRDGRHLLYEAGVGSNSDVWALSMSGDLKATRLLSSEFNERGGQFSPDGRWIVYESDEDGRPEIYVRPLFSGQDGSLAVGPMRFKMSKAGGTSPNWPKDSNEFTYVTPESSRWGVTLTNDPAFPFSEPTFVRKEDNSGGATADGKRVLALVPLADSAPAPFTVVLNWQSELGR